METSQSLSSLLLQAKYEEEASVKSVLIGVFVERCVREGKYEYLINASRDPSLPAFHDAFMKNILRAAFKRKELDSSDSPLLLVAANPELPNTIRYHAGMALVEKYKADFDEDRLNSLARDRRLPTEVRHEAGVELVNFHDLSDNPAALKAILNNLEMEYETRTEAGLHLIARLVKEGDYKGLLDLEDGRITLKVEEALNGKAELVARALVNSGTTRDNLESISKDDRISEAVRMLAKMKQHSTNGKPMEDEKTQQLMGLLARKLVHSSSPPEQEERRSSIPPRPPGLQKGKR